MSQITKIYLDFIGDIPEMDGVRECDWYIEIVGNPVSDEILESLDRFITERALDLYNEDGQVDYYELSLEALDFMVNHHGYKEYEDPADFKTIKININFSDGDEDEDS